MTLPTWTWTPYDLLFALTLVLNGALVAVLAWAFHRPWMEARRLPGYRRLAVKPAKRLRTMVVIGTLSLACSVAMGYGLRPLLFAKTPVSFGWALMQAVGIYVAYDFTYYWMHRGMHHPKLMRFVHREHHRAQFPTAADSLFQHPVELLSGLGLLSLCTWLVAVITGPIAPYAFLAVFFVYSMLNIFIHSGLKLPGAWMAPINFVIQKHYVHHKDSDANYASMSPLPDILFGTHRRFPGTPR